MPFGRRSTHNLRPQPVQRSAAAMPTSAMYSQLPLLRFLTWPCICASLVLAFGHNTIALRQTSSSVKKATRAREMGVRSTGTVPGS
jgi:hypothetical protein